MLSREAWQASLHRRCFVINMLLPRSEWWRSQCRKVRIGWPSIHTRNWGTVKWSRCNVLLQLIVVLNFRLSLHVCLPAISVKTGHETAPKAFEFGLTTADKILIRFIAFFCSFAARRSERRSSRPLFLYHSSNSDSCLLASDSVWERICNLKRFERWDFDDICVRRWETSENRGCFGQRLHSKGMEVLDCLGIFRAVTSYQSQHKEKLSEIRRLKGCLLSVVFFLLNVVGKTIFPICGSTFPDTVLIAYGKWQAASLDKDSFERPIGANVS